MIKIKNSGVKLTELCPQLVLVLCGTIQDIYKEHGSKDMVITSANDSKHSSGSKHYRGDAVDLRVWNLDNIDKTVDDIRQAIGMDFDVINEDDHIHLEYHPKRRSL